MIHLAKNATRTSAVYDITSSRTLSHIAQDHARALEAELGFRVSIADMTDMIVAMNGDHLKLKGTSLLVPQSGPKVELRLPGADDVRALQAGDGRFANNAFNHPQAAELWAEVDFRTPADELREKLEVAVQRAEDAGVQAGWDIASMMHYLRVAADAVAQMRALDPSDVTFLERAKDMASGLAKRAVAEATKPNVTASALTAYAAAAQSAFTTAQKLGPVAPEVSSAVVQVAEKGMELAYAAIAKANWKDASLYRAYHRAAVGAADACKQVGNPAEEKRLRGHAARIKADFQRDFPGQPI